MGRREGGRNTKIDVIIKLNERGDIFVDFGNSKLGEGSTKVFHKVMEYKTRAILADGVLNLPRLKSVVERLKHQSWFDPKKFIEDAKKRLNTEVAVLKAISELPPDQREGLPEVWHVGQDSVVMKLYDDDLEQVLRDPVINTQFEKDPEFLLDALSQMAHGMLNLHKMGYSHDDLKLSNILVSKKNGKYTFTVGDFERALRVESEIQSDLYRPSQGQVFYMAPEVISGWWLGTNPKEKVELGLKGDVFSFGNIAFRLKYGHDSPWVIECKSAPLNHLYEMKHCIASIAMTWAQRLEDSGGYTPFEYLLSLCFHLDPYQRPSSEQLAQAFDLMKHHPELGTSESTSKNLNRKHNLKNELQKHIQNEKPDLLREPPGTYFVKEVNLSNGEKGTVLSYVNLSRDVTTKLLATNSNPETIQTNVEFLKALGVIKTPLTLQDLHRRPLTIAHHHFEGTTPYPGNRLEVEDELHRYSRDLEKWYSLWQISAKYEKTFWDWLKDQPEAQKIPRVKYLDDKERAGYRADFDASGKLILGPSTSTNTARDGDLIFVLGKNEDLYIGNHLSGSLQHTSFLAGADVISAGGIILSSNGSIVGIDDGSGHYKPSPEHICHFMSYLDKKHHPIKQIKKIQLFFVAPPKVYKNVDDFIQLCKSFDKE